MTIYMQIPNVKGNVSADNYTGWIELGAIQFGASRSLIQTVGKTTDRSSAHPSIKQIEITKQLDKASHELLKNVLVGNSLGTVNIHVCRISNGAVLPYAKYSLEKTMVSNYQEVIGSDGAPQERITLSFTKLERAYIPMDQGGREQSPLIMGYDLETAKCM